MRRLLPLLFLAGCAGSAPPAPYAIRPADLVPHVEYLASDALEGRAPGSEGDRLAAEYVARQLADAGAAPLYENGYFQPVTGTSGGESWRSRNVAAVVPGTSRPEEYILFVAHHDGQGRCPADAGGDDICNGAVDNASGVAVLIELARRIAGQPAERSVIFLASAAEEQGLLGAKAFVDAPPVSLEDVIAVLGIDSIAARGYTADVSILGFGLTTLDPLVAAAARAENRRVRTDRGTESFYRRSDHAAFADAGIPALMVSGLFAPGAENFRSGVYARTRYHRPGDEAGRSIDYSGAAADASLLLRLTRMIAAREERPEWRRPPPPRPARPG